MSRSRCVIALAAHTAILLAIACDRDVPRSDTAGAGDSATAGADPARQDSGAADFASAMDGDPRGPVAAALAGASRDIEALADSIDELLQPHPLLTAAQERSLRADANAEHVARARALGVDPEDAGRRGRLATIPEDTTGWIVRELDHSEPLLTPAALALLGEIADRYQARLSDLGLPPFRVEVTSAFRTAETQRDLRSSNPNAAAGRSSHEFGTTFDLAYSGFAAPLQAEIPIPPDAPDWLRDHLRSDLDARLATVAARRSRELQQVLGLVLLELREEGRALVQLEVRQPVYHITVAR